MKTQSLSKNLLLTVALSAGFVAVASPAFAGKKACNISKGDNPVAKACEEKGIKGAKKIMKKMTRKAKKNGMKGLDCDTCHKNESDWTLTSEGKSKFKEMMKIWGK